MEGEDSESQDNKAFNNKSVWARISVVAAGPIFNFIMAFIFSFILVCCTGYDLPVLSDVSEGYAAEEAGLQAGDTIVKMGNKHIHFYREVSAYSMYHAGEPVKVKLHIREESSFAQRYDEVWVRIKEEGGVFVNATKEGIVFEEQQEGVQRRTGEWYLKDSRDGSGKTVTEVADGLVFVIDSEAPEVIFHRLSLEKNKIGGEERGLNFGTYQNTSYAEKVSVEDQNSLDERGSGVDRWSYAVWNVKKDQKLTKNLVEKLTISGELQWNPVEEETCEIFIGIENQGKVKEGNYVLLVRVEDQVQNQAMFLSDGIVVDLKQPKVTLRGIDSEKYYTEDIPFSITVEDFHLKNQKITSGIKEICVALSCDGTECFCETEQIRENFPKSGTEVEKTLQELQTEAKVSREQVRAKNKETLQAIIDNAEIGEEQKQQAVNEMIQLTDLSEKEVAVETLLASKGFSETVVNLTVDSADVVVSNADLTDANRAQIEDIVTRKTGIAPQNIVITPIHSGEEEAKAEEK